MAADLILLALGWVLWCALHSLLATRSVNDLARRLLGRRYAWYRLSYNLFAIVTVMPLVAWTLLHATPTVVDWQWPWTLLRGGMIICGLGLFYAGAQVYPMREFLGLEQARRYQQGLAQAGEGDLETEGVLAVTRHPWYLAAFLLLWGRDLEIDDLVTNVILTGYLGVGAVLEEKKMLLEFGERYRRYQQQVSMFLPVKWIRKKISGRA